MEGDIHTEAVKALRTAAERLGVDPYRLARFLSNGKLGEILDVLGKPARDDKRLDLAQQYLEFLDREIASRSTPRSTQKGNGGSTDR